MTEAQAIELVTQTFVTGWTTAMPAVPYTLRNDTLLSVDTFVLFTAMVTASRQTTQGPAGTRRVEYQGWIQIKTWVPTGTGAAPSARLADAARAIFVGQNLPSPVPNDEALNCGAAMSGAPTVDERWELGLIRIPMKFSSRI